MSEQGIKRTIVATAAFEAVDEIIADLNDRQGLDSAWDGIDSGIAHEIRQKWAAIVDRAIWKAVGE